MINQLSTIMIGIPTLTVVGFAAIMLLLLIISATSQFAWAQEPSISNNNANNSTGNNNLPYIFPADSQPYNLTYGEWTAKWWQWAESIPTEVNPQLDMTGENCAQGQNQTGPVWFLAGTPGGFTERTCTIPAGKAILFPVYNAINIAAGADINESEEDLRAGVKNMADAVIALEASIDGTPVPNLWSYRIEAPTFNATFPSDNVFGIPEGSYMSVADGYWVFLEPLPPGQHEIRLHAVATDPTATSFQNFETAVTYNLIISEDAPIMNNEQAINTPSTTNNTTTSTS
jgi:hypothetical protein